MNQYAYNGPVMEFGKCIANNWEGSKIGRAHV